jgi:GNAT superfamily N-acetyltransferase
MDAAVEHFAPREILSSRGARITVRVVRPEDEAGFHDAFLRLSSESRYTRFMSVVRDLSEATLHQATHPDGAREFALVAVAGEQIVAGGRFVAIPETTDCEFAVTVVDDWQGHGLGRALLTALKDAATSRGYGRMEGYVLSTNLAMRKLGARLGFADGPMPGDATTRLLVASLQEGNGRAAGG